MTQSNSRREGHEGFYRHEAFALTCREAESEMQSPLDPVCPNPRSMICFKYHRIHKIFFECTRSLLQLSRIPLRLSLRLTAERTQDVRLDLDLVQFSRRQAPFLQDRFQPVCAFAEEQTSAAIASESEMNAPLRLFLDVPLGPINKLLHDANVVLRHHPSRLRERQRVLQQRGTRIGGRDEELARKGIKVSQTPSLNDRTSR